MNDRNFAIFVKTLGLTIISFLIIGIGYFATGYLL